MKIPILMYHRIDETRDDGDPRYAVSPAMFRKQMDYLKREGYTPVGLGRLCERVNLSVQKPVVITFDDGYLDNYENAFPVLRDCGFPATVFVVSDLVGAESRWMNGCEKPLMGWREIEEMAKCNIAIGSHSRTHRRLSQLTPKEAETEVAGSKRVLEERLGFAVDHFAYPYGDYNRDVRDLVESSGYSTASSTASGFNSRETDCFELRRIEIAGTDSLRAFSIKLAFGTNDGTLAVPARYYLKKIVRSNG